jgi:FkbM family methyltransferase
MAYLSQLGQDKWVESYFKGKRNGVFLDVGAHNGKLYSNTFYLEKNLGWTGVCMEPNPTAFAELIINRSAHCLNCCVSNSDGPDIEFLKLTGYAEQLSGIVSTYDPRHMKRIERELVQYGGTKEIIKVPQRTLTNICNEFGITRIDYLSLDTEGSELQVLQGLDFNKIDVEVIDVENNYPDSFGEIHALLSQHGYIVATRMSHDIIYTKTANNITSKQ